MRTKVVIPVIPVSADMFVCAHQHRYNVHQSTAQCGMRGGGRLMCVHTLGGGRGEGLTFLSNSLVLLSTSFCSPWRLLFLACSLCRSSFRRSLSSSARCFFSSICLIRLSLKGYRLGIPGSFLRAMGAAYGRGAHESR